MFTCETDGGVSGWRINGTLLEDLPSEIKSDVEISVSTTAEGTTVESLIVPARAKFSGTKIQCLVLGFDGSAESENVTLKVQGMVAYCEFYSVQP